MAAQPELCTHLTQMKLVFTFLERTADKAVCHPHAEVKTSVVGINMRQVGLAGQVVCVHSS